MSLDQQTSNLFYQVISTRHSQKRSTLITTNTAFSDWGNILYNTTIATAIADRLVENSEIFLLGGDSLRKANKNPTPPEPSSSRSAHEQAPRCGDIPRGGVRRVTPQRRCRRGRELIAPAPVLVLSFSLHVQLQRQSSAPALADGIPNLCGVPHAGHSTQRVYRLYDFTKALLLTPGQYYCVAGKVNSADKLYLVIESVKLDTKHCRSSTTPAPADGAGGYVIGQRS